MLEILSSSGQKTPMLYEQLSREHVPPRRHRAPGRAVLQQRNRRVGRRQLAHHAPRLLATGDRRHRLGGHRRWRVRAARDPPRRQAPLERPRVPTASVSTLRERYTLSDGVRDLILLDGKGWGRRPVKITLADPGAVEPAMLLFTAFVVHQLAVKAGSAGSASSTAALSGTYSGGT